MLLDKYVLTKAFENLLSYHTPSTSASSAPHVPPAGFVKRVTQAMARVDPLLKTLQVRPSPPEGLVQAYLIHIGDRSDTNFRKILDLKGVRKQDQPHLVELFAIHRDGSGGASGGDRQLVQSSPLLTPLMTSASGGIGSSGLVSGMGMGAMGSPAAALTAGAAGLQTRFDAASLGEKLLNAARDGVERIGSTGTTGTSSASAASASTAADRQVGGMGGQGSGTPVLEKATINENLKSIGKFFRRDIGGLGARFGKRDITPTGSDEGQR